MEFGKSLLKAICIHFNVSVTDRDRQGPLYGMQIGLDYGLNIDQMLETKKVVKTKKPKGIKVKKVVASTSDFRLSRESIQSLSLSKHPAHSMTQPPVNEGIKTLTEPNIKIVDSDLYREKIDQGNLMKKII